MHFREFDRNIGVFSLFQRTERIRMEGNCRICVKLRGAPCVSIPYLLEAGKKWFLRLDIDHVNTLGWEGGGLTIVNAPYKISFFCMTWGEGGSGF